jgi:predicted helicase
MKLSKDKSSLRVNDSLTLESIPPANESAGRETWPALRNQGNRSALKWVIDQCRVTEDARSGIKSDPNREDDPEYIVRLVGQVIRVSVETAKIVAGLPEAYAQ